MTEAEHIFQTLLTSHSFRLTRDDRSSIFLGGGFFAPLDVQMLHTRNSVFRDINCPLAEAEHLETPTEPHSSCKIHVCAKQTNTSFLFSETIHPLHGIFASCLRPPSPPRLSSHDRMLPTIPLNSSLCSSPLMFTPAPPPLLLFQAKLQRQ